MAWQFESEAGYAIAVPLHKASVMCGYGAGGGALQRTGSRMQEGGACDRASCTTM